MPRKLAAAAGALALALSLAGIPSAAAEAGEKGQLSVTPGSVAPGESVTLSVLNPELMDQMDDDHRVTVHSDAFARPVRLAPSGKVSWKGRAMVRCDAEPGSHTLRFDQPVPPDEARTNGRVTVEARGATPRPECATAARGSTGSTGDDWTPATVTITAAALAVMAGLAFFAVRRHRRRP
ncbi:hypothetical protein [Streptomyces sp. NRRL S-920]|uniref:hypothetical protein n=1 Tax=Streptomyces sp. NRRL S-920 TaxID=1463921 RepID=UPI000A5B9FA2|nr:hypothetical protein [Streptomyces sp. NRRL S-920]